MILPEAAVLVTAILALLAGVSIGYWAAWMRQSLARQRGWDHLAGVAQGRPVTADDVVAAFGMVPPSRSV